jgi:hypothetical protein
MLGRKERSQLELFISGSLKQLIPDDHVLARFDRILVFRGCGMKSLTAIASMMVDLAPNPETVRLMLAGLLSGARDHAPL